MDADEVLLANNVTSCVETNAPLLRGDVLGFTLADAPKTLLSPASASVMNSLKATNGAPVEFGT